MFPPGSGPPSRAATMIARVSFEKSWPRFASVAPFFRLIDAHLLCPDKARLPDCVEEELVDAGVVRELGVEGSDQERPCRRSTGLPSSSARTSTSSPRLLDARRPDEDAAERVSSPRSSRSASKLETWRPYALRATWTSTRPRCSRSRTIRPAQVPRIGCSKLRIASSRPVEAHQAHEGRRLAAWHDEPVEPLELLRLAHLDRLRAEPPQHGRVLAEVPLESEDTDPHRGHYQPRVSSSSSGGMPAVARPVIASPRPCETRASTSASR